MFFKKNVKDNKRRNNWVKYIRSISFQRILTTVITVLLVFVIINSGAMPKKYKLAVNGISNYNITAPRDIENKDKTEDKARDAEEKVGYVYKDISKAPVDVINIVYEFLSYVDSARDGVQKSLQDKGITRKSKDYTRILEEEQAKAVTTLSQNISKMDILLSEQQVQYLIAKATDEDIASFKKESAAIISLIMQENITQENIADKIVKAQNTFQGSTLPQEIKNIGAQLSQAVIMPNKSIDVEITNELKKKAYEDVINNKKVIIKKDERIISTGEVVTLDKYNVLKELNLLETDSRFDYGFVAGLLFMIIMLAVMLILYIRFFYKAFLRDRQNHIILSIIILLTILISRGVFKYSVLAIPIFIAPMLVSILMDAKLAVVVNFVLSITLTFVTKGNAGFLYMSLISGTFAAFLMSKANQRSKLSMAGFVVALLNVLVIICVGLINKSGWKEISQDSFIVLGNGVISAVLTIGTLPFWESIFNVLTPLKLLELSNPNQPLLKKLLMEAPGTYHHSLMVGNLAEVATEIIGGNPLLARVGAYFHDVGKLKRPNFFRENQLTENPHDRMTPNLSTLVITSHTADGAKLAEKYKIPNPIVDIIRQHHGNTMVAYFYHKAKKGDNADTIKPEDYRYEGPRPSTKEAAVVMLADSVEAAVRSMVDRTEGKIEGLIRKIIKDKLDDGQLDLCNLTLKDLDSIARAFMKVLSGYYHEREEYPEMKLKENVKQRQQLQMTAPAAQTEQQEAAVPQQEAGDMVHEERKIQNGSHH